MYKLEDFLSHDFGVWYAISGAFLIPYFFMMIFAGMPLFYLELAIGQYAALGPITIWDICPLFKGNYALEFLFGVALCWISMAVDSSNIRESGSQSTNQSPLTITPQTSRRQIETLLFMKSYHDKNLTLHFISLKYCYHLHCNTSLWFPTWIYNRDSLGLVRLWIKDLTQVERSWLPVRW